MPTESLAEIHKPHIVQKLNQSINMHPVNDWVQTYNQSVRKQVRKSLHDFLNYIDMKTRLDSLTDQYATLKKQNKSLEGSLLLTNTILENLDARGILDQITETKK